jgi:hypothetical protein
MPIPNAKESFTYLTLITQNCHAILNTSLVAPEITPSWFDDLQIELSDAKKSANNWIDTLAPNITSNAPNEIINYSNTYCSFSKNIKVIADNHAEAKGPNNKYVKQVGEMVNVLGKELTSIIKDSITISDKLESWGDEMQKAHDSLCNGVNDIQNAKASLSADINEMNSAISNLTSQIQSENNAIARDKTEIGAGVALVIIGVLLAPETAGGSLVISGIGGTLVVAGTVEWAILQQKINDQFDEISSDQLKLSVDQRQLVALNGLGIATNQTLTNINQATETLSAFRVTWQLLLDELSGVMQDLEQAQSSLGVIVENAFTNAAQEEWNEAQKTASSMLNTTITVNTKQLPMSCAQPA